jgi:tetratricopeptide (TPR) repeat protein
VTQEKVSFIGREAEIEQIEDLINDWGTRRVLCIRGDGGVGKTRLLQEIRDRQRGETARSAVTDVLTFDDRTLHLPENLRYRLAETLGADSFEPYFLRFVDYQRMTRAALSRERLEQEREEVLEAFHACLREALSERRGVILFDTTDALEEGGSAWEYIASDLVPQPCNAVFLIAGRNAHKLHERLRSQIGKDTQLLELEPLDSEASMEYLLARQEQLHCVIDPEMAEKIVFLAHGRPILIDLAVDWLAHQRPLPWLEEESLEDLKKLSKKVMKSRTREFEHNLVRHVLELRTPIDRLLLALTHVYPVNASLAARLLGLAEQDTIAVLEDAQSYICVKQLPRGWLTLHDKAREMLEEVEAEVDPKERRKQSDNERAASYFKMVVHKLEEELRMLEEEEQAAQTERQAKEELEAVFKYTELEREYWLAAGQWLHHTLRISPSEGMDIFIRMFDEATDAYRFAVRDGFTRQVCLVYERLTSSQKYELDIRRVKDMLDSGRYQEGKDLLLEMLDYPDLHPPQQVDMHIQLGNLEIRLGDFKAGLESFERAVTLSRKHRLKLELMLALNARGWGHRLVGRFERAIEHYEEALELSIALEDHKREAWILNNIAFATARLGRHKAALSLCDQALELWQEVDFDRGLGAVHEVYGEVYVLSNLFDEALDHYRAALDIFEPSDDHEWLSRVYAGCGLAHRLAGDLDSAEEFLEKAQEMGVEKDTTMILHRLAHVYLARDDIAKAEGYFEKSYESSIEASDADLELNNLSDLAEIAQHKGQYDRLEEFAAKFEKYQKEWGDVDFPRAKGTLLKNMGDMVLCADPGDVDTAWQYYEQAFPLLAAHGDFRPYSVQVQLRNLNDLLEERQVPIETVKDLGRRLRKLWKRKGLDSSHPDALRFFVRWREGKYYA